MNDVTVGDFFYERLGRMWFIVSGVIGDGIVRLRSIDGATIYVKLVTEKRTNETTWRRCALEANTGRFFVVTCRCYQFEYRGFDGPPHSRFEKASLLVKKAII